MAVERFLDLLSSLIQPASVINLTDRDAPEEDKFDASLKRNISKVQTQLQHLYSTKSHVTVVVKSISETSGAGLLDGFDLTDTDCASKDVRDVRWEFVKWNLALLLCLKEAIDQELTVYKSNNVPRQNKHTAPPLEHTAPPLAPDTLSFHQQKCVLTSGQFIACLGMCPSFVAGVGIPVEHRSGLGHFINTPTDSRPGPGQAEYRLWTCVRVLFKCISQPTLGGLILSRHLGDILASLIQICHAPRKSKLTGKSDQTADEISGSKHGDTRHTTGEHTPTGHDHLADGLRDVSIDAHTAPRVVPDAPLASTDTTCKVSPESSKLEAATLPVSDKLLINTADRSRAAQDLSSLVDNAYQPALVRELLMLQGGASPNPTTKPPGPPTRPPAWFGRACSRLLSSCLLRANGVQNILQAMLDTSTACSDADLDWKKIDVASRVLATCPGFIKSSDSYYQNIAPQVLQLLGIDDVLRSVRYRRVVARVISYVFQRDRQAAEKYLIAPLLAALLRCGQEENFADVSEPVLLIAEADLYKCICNIHKVLFGDGPVARDVLNILCPVLHVLFCVYRHIRNGVSSLRQPVEDILALYLKHGNDSLNVLDIFITENNSEYPVFIIMNSGLRLTLGGDGGVAVLLMPHGNTRDPLEDWESTSSAILDLLRKTDENQLIADLFIFCLKHLTKIISEEISEMSKSRDTDNPSRTFLELDDPLANITKLRVNLTVLALLAAMCDTYGPSCLRSAKHIVEFVKATLDRCIRVLDNTDDVAMGTFEGETVTMAMGLLSSALSGEVTITASDRELSKALLPMLQKVHESYPDPVIKQFALDLSVIIATQGRVIPGTTRTETDSKAHLPTQGRVIPDTMWTETDSKAHLPTEGHDISGTFQKKTDMKTQTEKKTHLPSEDHVISDTLRTQTEKKTHLPSEDHVIPDTFRTQTEIAHLPSRNPDSSGTDRQSLVEVLPTAKNNVSKDNICDGSFEGALAQLKDDALPVRGHGLIVLRRLLEANDTEAVTHKSLVLKALLECIQHGDTYIYLGAIEGLAALARLDPDQVLPVLMEQFVRGPTTATIGAGLKERRLVELRMKIGEVLVKASKCLGEMAPKYRDILLGGFLHSAKDEDPHMRASSVSNLGEICRILRYSLGNNIHEILECIRALLGTDRDVEVRRATAMVTTFLLRGLGPDSLKVLGSSLRDLYRLLKLQTSVEKDSTTLLHLQMSLEELDVIMRDLLFPKQTLEKKIHILSPP